MSAVYLALGSNLGDRAHNLHTAIEALAPEVTIGNMSPVYETAPQYVRDQPLFLNAVVEAETRLSPNDLLVHLKGVEENMGRTPTVRNGPRLIDLDILFYDDVHIETSELTIPHPRMSERAFVLAPLADIAPELLHPTQKTTIRELFSRLALADTEIRKTDLQL